MEFYKVYFLFGVLGVMTVVGFLLGYPDVLWVWAVYFFMGWSEEECSCPDCDGREHPENKESPIEIIKRRYVEGEISESEMEQTIEKLNEIEDLSDREINEELSLQKN